MALGAIIGAVLGIGSSILNNQAQEASSSAQYAEAERQARARYDRDVKEWELANLVAETQWWWDKARVEQLRFNERQKASDYAGYQGAMIGAAAKQLTTRIDGLKTGLASQLVGLQMRDSARLASIGIDARGQLGEVSGRLMVENQTETAKAALDYSSKMQALTIETLEAARQYLVQSEQQALEADQMVGKLGKETDEIIQSLALEEQRDYLGWQLNKIAALAAGSQAGNTAIVRQGGGKTSKLLMAEAAKQLGRRWGEMEVQAKSRQTKLGLLNKTMNDELAMQMGKYALSIQDMADRTAYAIKRGDNEKTLLSDTLTKLVIPGMGLRAQLANVQMESIYSSAASRINLTMMENISAKGNAFADYINARDGAFADFGSAVASYSKPYRQEEYFDPIRPIPGLKPEYIGPTQPSGGNAVFTIGNAILSGAQGAMQFSYKKNDGSIGFY